MTELQQNTKFFSTLKKMYILFGDYWILNSILLDRLLKYCNLSSPVLRHLLHEAKKLVWNEFKTASKIHLSVN